MNNDVWWSISFANDGGPLIILPRELLSHWHGSEPHSDQEQVELDCDRACEVNEPAEAIAVGPGIGVVIGAREMVYTAQWLRFGTSPEIFCVGWYYGDEESELLVTETLCKSQLHWKLIDPQAQIEGELILMHVVNEGEEITEVQAESSSVFRKLESSFQENRQTKSAGIGDGIPLRMNPGTYMIEMCVLGGDLQKDSFGCVLCRWRPS